MAWICCALLKRILQVNISNASYVLEVCAVVSHGCCKSRSGCCICCNGCTMLQASVPNVLAVLDVCCKCFNCFGRMLQMFSLDVAKKDLVLHML